MGCVPDIHRPGVTLFRVVLLCFQHALLEEKVLKRFYQRYVFGTPKWFYIEPFFW